MSSLSYISEVGCFDNHKKQRFNGLMHVCLGSGGTKNNSYRSLFRSGQSRLGCCREELRKEGGVPRTTLRYVNDGWGINLLATLTEDQTKACMKLNGELSYSAIGDGYERLVHLVLYLWMTNISRRMCNRHLHRLKKKAKELTLTTKDTGSLRMRRMRLFRRERSLR